MARSDDRLDIIELIYRYAAVIDLRRYDDIPIVFADDAECDYSSMRAYLGDDTNPRGRVAIERWIRRHTGTRSSMHFMHNQVVDFVDDHHARMRNYMHNTNSSIAGIYEIDARRTPDGWRIARLRLDERFLDADRVAPTPATD